MTSDPLGRRMVGPGKSFMEQRPKARAGTLTSKPMLEDGTKRMAQSNAQVQGQVRTVALQAELQRTRTSMLPTGQANYGLSREITKRGRRGF